MSTAHLNRNDLREIFQPVFEEIDKLVAQQVNEVRIKRMSLNHPKGAAIKVKQLWSDRLDRIGANMPGYLSGRRIWRELVSQGKSYCKPHWNTGYPTQRRVSGLLETLI